MGTGNDEQYNHGREPQPQPTWARWLRASYGDVPQEPLPERVRDLLEQLEEAES